MTFHRRQRLGQISIALIFIVAVAALYGFAGYELVRRLL